jgi:hypothetical protein
MGFYQMAGGLDFDYFSQLRYPPSRGGGGDAVANYSFSRRDTLVSRLSGEYVYVVLTQIEFVAATYMESIRHAFSRRTTGTLGAGVSLRVRNLGNRDVLSGAVVAAGEATIVHTSPLHERGQLTYRAGITLGQAYNPFLANVLWQGNAILSAIWSRDPVTVGVSASAATSLPFRDRDAARAAFGTVTLGYALARAVTLQTGVRGYTQLLPSELDATIPPQWVAFVALLLSAPPARF